MNNLDTIGVDELDYGIYNHIKIYWFATDAYEFNKDDNNGYIYGIVSWVGQYDLDIVADYYNSDGSNISWEWFKTEQERDQALKENEDKDHLFSMLVSKTLKENEDE